MLKRSLAPTIATALFVFFTAITGVGQSVAGDSKSRFDPHGLREDLAGSWNVIASTPLQGQIPVLITFTSDGTVLGNEPPTAFESTGHGNWISTSRNKAAYTFRAFVGSDTNQLTAIIEIVGKLTYSSSRDKWDGPFRVTVYDATGSNVLFQDSGTFAGSRIQVKSLN